MESLSETLTVEGLAQACGKTVIELESLCDDASLLLREPKWRLIKGKVRQIEAPTPLGRRVLKRLHRFLQRHFPPHRIVHGGARGRSCFSSAAVHAGRKLIVTRDIIKCYPSITRAMIHARLLRLGMTVGVADVLAGLLAPRRGLPQGSPASGSALNIYFGEFDERLHGYCSRNGFRVSRTYDDIIVSTDDLSRREEIERFLEDEARAIGLAFSQKKIQRRGMQVRGAAGSHRLIVHNLDVTEPGTVRINADQANKAIDAAIRYRDAAKAVSATSIERVAKLRQVAVGHMRHVGQASRGPYRNVKQLIDAGDRAGEKAIQRHGVGLGSRKWFQVSGRVNEPKRLREIWSN